MDDPHDLAALLQQTHDPDPRIRRHAVARLCPCHVKRTHERVWERVIAMATTRIATSATGCCTS